MEDGTSTTSAPAGRTPAPQPTIDPASSVNDVLRRYPATVAVFNAFGVDACCRGANSLHAAARDANVEPADLLVALDAAVRDAAEVA